MPLVLQFFQLSPTLRSSVNIVLDIRCVQEQLLALIKRLGHKLNIGHLHSEVLGFEIVLLVAQVAGLRDNHVASAHAPVQKDLGG